MEPLELLKAHVAQFTSDGGEETIKEDGDDIVVKPGATDEVRFPKDTKTAYKSKRGSGDFYTVHALWFFLKSRMHEKDAKYPEYRRKCRSQNITDVNVLDRKDLASYLTIPDATSAFVRPDELVVAPQAGEEAEKDTQKTKKRKKAESKVDVGLDADAADKPILMNVDTDVLQNILAQETVLRDYNSILNVQGRPSKVSKKDKSVKIGQGKYSTDAAEKARHDRAARQDQLQGSKIVNPNKREEAWMMNRQRELDKAGQGSNKEGDFDAESFERQMMNNEHGSLMGSKKDKKKKAKEAAKVGSGKIAAPKEKESKKLVPIIMLPQGRTALVNMINGIQFLRDGTYLDADARKTCRKPDRTKPVYIERRHVSDGRVVKYQLCDNAKSLQPQEWARVVMVLIQGPEWQFKGWKWEKEGMSSILDKVCGFHVQYEDEETPPQVKNWACKVVKLSKHKRHQDRIKMASIWKDFDLWCGNKGSKLANHLAL